MYNNVLLTQLSRRIHKTSVDHGFWPPEGRNFGEMIALIHSELSEALEAHRDDDAPYWEKHEDRCALFNSAGTATGCTCNPKPEGAGVELADALIRILDTFNHPSLKDVDIDDVVSKKMLYNESRPYKHGRQY